MGVGVVSISWLIFEILDRWINSPEYRNVQILIAKVKGAPALSIRHVLGNVAVPKIFPSSNNPTKFNNKPTRTIEIKGQLLIIYKKSIFDNFHNRLKFAFCEKF